MKKLLIIEAILNGLVKLIRAIKCKSSCCIESSCGESNRQEQRHVEPPVIKNITEL